MNNKTFAALSEKPFLYLWTGEVLTQIPTHLFNFFLILLVFKITNSNTAVSGVVLSFTIPAIIFGSVAGVFVDRWDKKKVLIISNVLRAVLMIFLIFFLDNLFVIYLTSLIVSILVQFFIPAETPMIPLVVKKRNLLSANALFGMAIFASILIAYVLSGPALIFLKPVNTLIALALMLLTGAFAISFIKPRAQRKRREDPLGVNFVRDVKRTLSLMHKTQKISRSLLLLALSQIIILIIATIAPGYARDVLSIQIEDFSLIFAAPAALGMVAGAVILVKRFHSHPKDKIIASGILMSGIGMLFLPYGSRVASRGFVQALNDILPVSLQIDILHIIIVIAFALGLANAFVFVTANTILQEQTTDDVRGKLYGFLNSTVGLLSLVPIIAAGGLSDLIGVGAVITGLGISLLILGAVWLYQLRNS
jgi:MFS family permease